MNNPMFEHEWSKHYSVRFNKVLEAMRTQGGKVYEEEIKREYATDHTATRIAYAAMLGQMIGEYQILEAKLNELEEDC